MSVGWRIVPASDALAHLPTLAGWHVAEWAALFPGWTTAEALAELEGAARAVGPVPATLVALAEADGAPLGSISLLAEDSPDLRAFEGPWLASLYVRPEARERGLGEALVRALVAHAVRAGLPRLRLFTPRHRAFYERLGWRVESRSSSGCEAVDVMVLALAAAADSTPVGPAATLPP